MIGYLAGKEITTKNKNTIIGFEAVYSSSANDDLVVVGYKAGYNLKGDSENGGVLIGSQAGYNLTDDTSYMGASNMFIGYQFGYNFTTANPSMGIGYKALWGEYVGANGNSHSNIYGSNLAIGNFAYAGGNTTGFGGSTYLGHYAGEGHVGGSSVHIGYEAGRYQASGSEDVYIGYNAGKITHLSGDVRFSR